MHIGDLTAIEDPLLLSNNILGVLVCNEKWRKIFVRAMQGHYLKRNLAPLLVSVFSLFRVVIQQLKPSLNLQNIHTRAKSTVYTAALMLREML